MPNWALLSVLQPNNTEWAYTSPTDGEWFRLDQDVQLLYPGSAIGLIADAEFLPDGTVNRTKSEVLFHSLESTSLYRPRPRILSEGNRRIAIRRLPRTPSYTPWNLQLYESDLMGLYNQPTTTTSEQPSTDATPTTFSAVTYNVATPAASYQALAANPNRRLFSVTNTGSAPVRIDFDAPASATSFYISVAAGSTYKHDQPYTGTIFIWSSNATAQSCNVREFT